MSELFINVKSIVSRQRKKKFDSNQLTLYKKKSNDVVAVSKKLKRVR